MKDAASLAATNPSKDRDSHGRSSCYLSTVCSKPLKQCSRCSIGNKQLLRVNRQTRFLFRDGMLFSPVFGPEAIFNKIVKLPIVPLAIR